MPVTLPNDNTKKYKLYLQIIHNVQLNSKRALQTN